MALEGQYEDPNAAALKLRNGDLDVFTGDIPNPERSVKRNPNTDFYYAPAGTTVVTPNLDRKPFDDVKFREALAYGIDKEQATLKATYGVMKPASQTMLKLPVQAGDLPAKYADTQGYIPYDPAKAAASCWTRRATSSTPTDSGSARTASRSTWCSACRPATSTTSRWPTP